MLKFSDYEWTEITGNDGAIGFVGEDNYEYIIVDRYWPETSGCGTVENEEERAGNISLILNAPKMYKFIKSLESAPLDPYDLQQLLSEIENG